MASNRVAPLTHERVLATLDRMGAGYTVDSDGDLLSIWDGNAFYIYLLGEGDILQVLGSWGRIVPNTEFEKILLAANDVHASRLYPHISVEQGEGGLRVSTRHPGDFQHGATDDQLTLHITNALSSALAYFNELDAQYPDAEPAAYNR